VEHDGALHARAAIVKHPRQHMVHNVSARVVPAWSAGSGDNVDKEGIGEKSSLLVKTFF
jgi:hypothetical protein